MLPSTVEVKTEMIWTDFKWMLNLICYPCIPNQKSLLGKVEETSGHPRRRGCWEAWGDSRSDWCGFSLVTAAGSRGRPAGCRHQGPATGQLIHTDSLCTQHNTTRWFGVKHEPVRVREPLSDRDKAAEVAAWMLRMWMFSDMTDAAHYAAHRMLLTHSNRTRVHEQTNPLAHCHL